MKRTRMHHVGLLGLLGLLDQTPDEENRMKRVETLGDATLSIDIISARGTASGDPRADYTPCFQANHGHWRLR